MTDQGFYKADSQHRLKHRVSPLPLTAGLAALALLTGKMPPLLAQTGSPITPTPTQQTPVNARILYVNPATGQDVAGAGTTAVAPYRSITYALSQVADGQQAAIQLAPGTYSAETGETFPLTLNPGVTVRGDEATKGQTTLIRGGGNYASPTFGSQNVAVRARQDSQLRGVTVTNTNTRGSGVWVESTNPTIQNNTFTNNNREGIFVTGRGNPTIESNIFTQNPGNGISVAKEAQGVIRDNVFRNTGFGVVVSQTASPTLEGNQITQNTDGIVVSDAAKPVLRRNRIEANTRDGVVAITNAQPNLGTASEPGENIIQNNARYDIYNATRSNTILAVGNQSATQKVQGPVDFVARDTNLPGGFVDVAGSWAEPYINALAAKNVISGFPDGTFRPSEPVTRAQFAAIVNKAFNPAPQRGGFNFSDVSSNFWGYNAIQTAYRGGFLSGYPNGQFRPDLQIPRVQVLVSLASGLGLTSADNAVLSVYQDQGQIPSYALDKVAAATRRGVVVNYPTVAQLNPNQTATRADVAAFVYQALVQAGQAEAIPSPYVVQVP